MKFEMGNCVRKFYFSFASRMWVGLFLCVENERDRNVELLGKNLAVIWREKVEFMELIFSRIFSSQDDEFFVTLNDRKENLGFEGLNGELYFHEGKFIRKFYGILMWKFEIGVETSPFRNESILSEFKNFYFICFSISNSM